MENPAKWGEHQNQMSDQFYNMQHKGQPQLEKDIDLYLTSGDN